ncbi:MAG: MFS transporter [Verrucomicrobiota bacterium]
MTLRQFKTNVFIIEGSNAFATGIYFNWIFFYTQNRLHFGVSENLGLVALHGLIYTGAAWFGGWFAHRFGKFAALKIGFAIMSVALGAGNFLPFAPAQVAVMLGWTFGMCFTWATLQSLISDREPADRLPRMAGIYNIVWSGVSAVSYFVGGALLEKFGITALFWIPAAIHLVQLAHVFWLGKKEVAPEPEKIIASPIERENLSSERANPVGQKKFLRYALLANPFAYVAINTAIPMIPVVAKRFELSPTMTGVFCSVWFFVRMGAFIWFWLWPGWHYRFGILLTAKISLVVSFIALMLAPQFWILLVAQIFFGLSVGLIYYSSLYYSMHGGASKSQHGGVHEAVIGLGTLVGASVGVGANYFFPEVSGVSIWAVSGLLLGGLFALIWLRYRKENG